MKVIVTGCRDWRDARAVRFVLASLLVACGVPFTLIEGGARGADRAAGEWGQQMEKRMPGLFTWVRVEAQWEEFGRAAGPIRNVKMLREERPDLVVAFHGDLQSSKGTRHMVEIAEAAGVEVWLFDGRNSEGRKTRKGWQVETPEGGKETPDGQEALW